MAIELGWPTLHLNAIHGRARVHHAPEALAALEPEAAALAALIAVGRRVIDGPTAEWERWAPVASAQVGIDDIALAALADDATEASN